MQLTASRVPPTSHDFRVSSAANKLTLIIWTNLTVSLDGQQTANSLFVKMLDRIYVVHRCRLPHRRPSHRQGSATLTCWD